VFYFSAEISVKFYQRRNNKDCLCEAQAWKLDIHGLLFERQRLCHSSDTQTQVSFTEDKGSIPGQSTWTLVVSKVGFTPDFLIISRAIKFI
jgi:hypothetical protein